MIIFLNSGSSSQCGGFTKSLTFKSGYEQIARYVMVKTPIEPADLAFVFGTQKMILPINYFRSLKNNGPRIPSSGRESCSSGKKSPATNR